MRTSAFTRILWGLVVLVPCGLAVLEVFRGTAAGAAALPPNLLAEARWQYSLDEGKTFFPEPPTVEGGKTADILARVSFNVAEPGRFVVLELTHGLGQRRAGRAKLKLNGAPITTPLRRMNYRTIPAIDAKRLVEGENVLTVELAVQGASAGKKKAKGFTFKPDMRLAALAAGDLKIQTGPILGAAGEDYFTVTCRTNMPAEVSVYRAKAAERELELKATTKLGLIHRLKVPADQAAAQDEHLLLADSGHIVAAPLRPSCNSGKDGLRFAAAGDCRSFPKDWATVAAAIRKAKPALLVFSGDMVTNGLNDWQWDSEFWAPARELLAMVPFYAVIGNHEANAPLYDDLFYGPSPDGRAHNWAQQIGTVLIIGVDGGQHFASGSKNAKWLEATLGASKARFIFLASHYPAWSSSAHGKVDEDGRSRELSMRQSREVIMPLLEKYKATAMITGHDHCYERSEPPGGVTHIITGGAGAPPYGKSKDAARQNPHSKVFVSKLHYCLFDIKGDSCVFTAITPEGKVLDTRNWPARKITPD